jgi:hypothetical protein
MMQVRRKWASDDYLIKQFGGRKQHMLKSESNHFMYWNQKEARKQKKDGYRPPTTPLDGTFEEFIAHRDAANTSPIMSEHVYLQLNSDSEHMFIPRVWRTASLSLQPGTAS